MDKILCLAKEMKKFLCKEDIKSPRYSATISAFNAYVRPIINLFSKKEDKSIDWRRVKIQAAIAAMQGFCANPSVEMLLHDMAKLSVEQADALIKELKKNI